MQSINQAPIPRSRRLPIPSYSSSLSLPSRPPPPRACTPALTTPPCTLLPAISPMACLCRPCPLPPPPSPIPSPVHPSTDGIPGLPIPYTHAHAPSTHHAEDTPSHSAMMGVRPTTPCANGPPPSSPAVTEAAVSTCRTPHAAHLDSSRPAIESESPHPSAGCPQERTHPPSLLTRLGAMIGAGIHSLGGLLRSYYPCRTPGDVTAPP